MQEPANKLSVLMVAPLYRQGGDTETVESKREHFTGIVLGVLRIDGLVNILDFSKIEAGKFHLDSVDFNVSDLCENVCSLLAVTAQSKGLEFNCFIQPICSPRCGAMRRGCDRFLLLVEDNLVNQRVALKMLEHFGLTARLANDGSEDIKELEENLFDLVFMDCQIPIMDGYSVIKSQREREQRLGLPRTPIVALTANDIQGDSEKSVAVGMDGHLTKPLSFKALEQALTHWLSNQGNTSEQEIIEESEVNMSEPIWDYHATLLGACGDVKLLEELKVLFADEAGKLIRSMGKEDAPQPASAIASAAHSLKGMSGHFHAKTVVELSAEVERIAKSGNIGSGDPLILRLCHEVNRLIDALHSVS